MRRALRPPSLRCLDSLVFAEVPFCFLRSTPCSGCSLGVSSVSLLLVVILPVLYGAWSHSFPRRVVPGLS